MYKHVSRLLLTLGIGVAFAAASSAASPQRGGSEGPWQVVQDAEHRCETTIPHNWVAGKSAEGYWKNPDGRSVMSIESTPGNQAREHWDTHKKDANFKIIEENKPLGRVLIAKLTMPNGNAEYMAVYIPNNHAFSCLAVAGASDRNEAMGLDQALLTIARNLNPVAERRGLAAPPPIAMAAYNGPWQVVQDAAKRCQASIPASWVAGKSAAGYWKNPDGRSTMSVESTDGNQARAQWDRHAKDANFRVIEENKALGRVLVSKLTMPNGNEEYLAVFISNNFDFSCYVGAAASDRNEAVGLDQTLLTIAKSLDAVAQQRKGVPAPPPLPALQGGGSAPVAGGRMQPLFDNSRRCEASIPASWAIAGPGMAGERNEAAGIMLDAKNDINMARKQWDLFVDPHSLLANTQTAHIGKQKDNGDGETYLVLILVPGKPFACSALVQVAKTADVPRYDAMLQTIARSVHAVQ